MTSRGLAFLVLFPLSACADVAVGIPVSPNAVPGPAFMPSQEAGMIFAKACLSSGPNFEDAAEQLAAYPFTLHAITGTYYHNTANLSVRAAPESCSLVFATAETIDDTVAGLANGTLLGLQARPPAGIDVTSSKEQDGNVHFRIGIQSPSP